ncbi:T9SS type A sorting domain-containing protein [Chitinophaga defluvii]|uniref:T9SS type A sorting domain-containing protein n=1 Tax=Chitinophaga defluvii TaxID=3163343 RepID=A0ABV2TBZ0_9BACT
MKLIYHSCKILLLFTGLLLLSYGARAQLLLNRQVVASSGGSNTVNNILFEYTIGEAAVMTLSQGSMILTQGFNQPEVLPKQPPGANPVLSYMLYPNPAATTLKIELDLLTDATVTFQLFNTAGQLVYQQYKEFGAGKVIFPIAVNRFAAGIYTVKLKVNASVFFEKLIIQ